MNSKIKTKYTNKSLIYNKVETKDTTVNHIILLITIFAIVDNHKTNPAAQAISFWLDCVILRIPREMLY